MHTKDKKLMESIDHVMQELRILVVRLKTENQNLLDGLQRLKKEIENQKKTNDRNKRLYYKSIQDLREKYERREGNKKILEDLEKLDQ